MSANCEALMNEVGSGVAAALRAVDCTASEVSAAAFGRLFAPGGAMAPVLTMLLGLFIAFFAIALLLGRSNLSVRSLVPRMLTLGLVVTFATSWVAYQTVVWNLAIGAPDYLASILTGSQGSATTTFADKIDIVFLAVQQATEGVGGQAQGAQQGGGEITAFSPQGILWLGALLLLLGTVGVLVTARIGLALLVALGPIFVVMALFTSTRGLFVGWLKGVVMLGLTPLFAVLGGGVMLELAVPILSSLSQVPGQIDPRSAMAFFLIGAVHVALMIMVLKVSATMVSGWKVFGLVADEKADRDDAPFVQQTPAPAPASIAPLSTAQAAGMSSPPRRTIPVSGIAPSQAANDTAGGDSAVTKRETKVFATTSGSGQVQPLTPAASRTNGIGNRFRSASSNSSEKLK
ncbi:type IV secretion system protein [Pontixanthobacter aestiaquae]|uniref:Type VI secretion protein n=1 Tax=Pontixanthobacter aestiaquae TaxID=1509367 RepID=A0A844ZB34_9SPHN|nr:type IV secretion system protein [Pontixanthobacter aestiaquae]MDN3644679.1 type IV secretion system protein [Pontixanthobacter aestiaquae]MXO84313.1 type VI secretion protein [Pontixanthobacter aestiaquae]